MQNNLILYASFVNYYFALQKLYFASLQSPLFMCHFDVEFLVQVVACLKIDVDGCDCTV